MTTAGKRWQRVLGSYTKRHYYSDAEDWLIIEETSLYSWASIALIIFTVNSQTGGCTNVQRKTGIVYVKLILLGTGKLLFILVL